MAETSTLSAKPGSTDTASHPHWPRRSIREEELKVLPPEALPTAPPDVSQASRFGNWGKRRCIVRGCNVRIHCRGLCKRHHRRHEWYVRGRYSEPQSSLLPREVQDRIMFLYVKRFQSANKIEAELRAEGIQADGRVILHCVRANGGRVRRRGWRGDTHHLPQQLVATMVWLYEDCGWSAKQIAAWRGRKVPTIIEQLKYNGVKMRPQSKWAPYKEEWRRRHYKEGETWIDIAAEYGIHYSTVKRTVDGRYPSEARQVEARRRDREYRRRLREEAELKSVA